MRCTINLQSFDDLPMSRKQIAMRAILEALVVANWNYLIEHDVPRLDVWLKNGGVRLQREPSETWLDIPSIIALGSAGQKDLACWRVAELRHDGEDDVAPFISVTYAGDAAIYRIGVRRGMKVEWFDGADR